MNRMCELRMQQLKRAGCCACAYLGIVNTGTDVHHILSGGQRLGDWFTILLCPGHHRGVWTPELMELIPVKKRVAISDGRKAFTRVYPCERQLWEETQNALGLTWPESKILPRVA
jgi:hypothetical protein